MGDFFESSIFKLIATFTVLVSLTRALDINETLNDLELPRVNISWSPMGNNFTYKLNLKKVQGLNAKEPQVLTTQNDFMILSLDFESKYMAQLSQKAPNSPAFLMKSNVTFITSKQKNKLMNNNVVKILILYNKKASYYQIIIRKLQEKQSFNNLPLSRAIKQNDLDLYTSNHTQYITLNITQQEMNGTNLVFSIGTGKIRNGVLNAKLEINKGYSTFQRTFFPDKTSISHPWLSQFVIKNNGAIEASSDDETVIISISVLMGVIAFILILVFCCHWKYSRNYAPKPVKKKRTDPVQRQSTDPSIPVTETDFYDHVAQMKFHNFKGFYEEFAKMTVEFKPNEEFRKPDNVIKNRFVNIPCYDHSRVTMSSSSFDDDNAYIHANFVGGFETDQDYILTQSPLPETIQDFWNMVLEYKIETVIMIGQMVEKGNNVCAPYFPTNEDESVDCINGEISLIHTHQTADYVIRTLVLKSGDKEETRRIKHFQFLSWPAVRITPACPTIFLQFMKAVNKSLGMNKANHPLVIHGTTGTGRSGIYACVDAQIRRIKRQGDVNVYNSVFDVREARYDGVKTLDEYIFIHDTVLEWILKKNIQDIEVEYLPHYIENINKTARQELFLTEYSFLAATVVSANQKADVANQPVNKSKNRYDNVKPFDSNRVKLTKLLNCEGSDYINASYIDTYNEKHSFIATQAPLVATVSDFWRMIYENESWVIVLLGQEIEKGQLKADRFWPEEGYVMALGNISVKYISKQNDNLKDVIIRQVEIHNTKSGERKLVQLYQYLTWPSHEAITSESINSLVQLVYQSQIWKEKLQAKLITVVSSSGIGRPGVFIALRYLQEESEREGFVNIFQAVQKLRQQRAALIQSREEYILIYTSTMEITKHVRRRSIVAESLANVDVSQIGLNIVPNSVIDSERGAIMERLNSVSQTSQF